MRSIGKSRTTPEALDGEGSSAHTLDQSMAVDHENKQGKAGTVCSVVKDASRIFEIKPLLNTSVFASLNQSVVKIHENVKFLAEQPP